MDDDVVWARTGGTLELFEEVRVPHSLGPLYSAITTDLGIDVNDAEYKVMGRAPYGQPRFVDRVRSLIEELPGGQFRLDLRYFDFLTGTRMFSDDRCRLFGAPPRQPEIDLGEFTKDVARSAQVVLEGILLGKARWLHEQVRVPRPCLAGGVALNLREGRELFVQPAASDTGAALIALLDADHALHASVTRWFGAHVRSGWASSPITQNGCVRVMSHPAYPNPVPVHAVMERLGDAMATPHHEFWPDDVSLLDPRVADAARIHGPRQVTDLYLLALAVRHEARFVTFDRAIALTAVRGAKAKHRLVL